jgi:hypothetical protein
LLTRAINTQLERLGKADGRDGSPPGSNAAPLASEIARLDSLRSSTSNAFGRGKLPSCFLAGNLPIMRLFGQGRFTLSQVTVSKRIPDLDDAYEAGLWSDPIGYKHHDDNHNSANFPQQGTSNAG